MLTCYRHANFIVLTIFHVWFSPVPQQLRLSFLFLFFVCFVVVGFFVLFCFLFFRVGGGGGGGVKKVQL